MDKPKIVLLIVDGTELHSLKKLLGTGTEIEPIKLPSEPDIDPFLQDNRASRRGNSKGREYWKPKIIRRR